MPIKDKILFERSERVKNAIIKMILLRISRASPSKWKGGRGCKGAPPRSHLLAGGGVPPTTHLNVRVPPAAPTATPPKDEIRAGAVSVRKELRPLHRYLMIYMSKGCISALLPRHCNAWFRCSRFLKQRLDHTTGVD